MKDLILKTDTGNVSYFIVRVTLGVVILAHGLQKLVGAFGGFGFEASMSYFTETVGVPWVLGFLVIIGESIGMGMLIAGAFSRLVAASLVVILFGAASVNASNGFFMNWFGKQPGEGVEFFILAIAMALVVAIKGGGKWSVDGWLSQTIKREPALSGKLETN